MTNKNMYTEKNINTANTANTAVKDKATKKGIFIGAVAVAMVGVIAAGAMVFGVMNAPKLSKTAAPTTAISVKNDAPALTANKKSAELTKATTAPTENVTAKKATDTTATQKKAVEVKAAQKKVEAQKAAQKKAAEKKLAEKKAAEKKAAEIKAAKMKAEAQKAAQKKAAQKKAAEKKLAEQKTAAAKKAVTPAPTVAPTQAPTVAPTQAPTVAPTEASVKTLFKTSSTTDDTIKIVNGERVFIDTKSPVPTNSGNPYAYTAHGKTSKGGFGWDYKADSLSVFVRCDYNFDREEYNFQCFGVTPGISHVTLMYNTADDVQVPVNLTLSVDNDLNVSVLPNA